MRCAVFNCDNVNLKNKNMRFFCFPKNSTLLDKWKQFCMRGDAFNVKTSRICFAHFKAEDFERNMQHDMGFCTRFATKLKPGTVPSVYTNSLKNNSKRRRIKKSMQIISTEIKHLPPQPTTTANNLLLAESKYLPEQPCTTTKNSVLTESNHLPEKPFATTNTFVERLKEENESLKRENLMQPSATAKNSILTKSNHLPEKPFAITNALVERLKQENESLKRENCMLRETGKEYVSQIKALQLKIKQRDFEKRNIEEKLKEIFTVGQINKLKKGSKLQRWTENDITKSITLYSASPRAYKLLLKRKFPLPSIRTLQTWNKKNCYYTKNLSADD